MADPGFLKGGFSFSLTKTPAQFELKTKKKKKKIYEFQKGVSIETLKPPPGSATGQLNFPEWIRNSYIAPALEVFIALLVIGVVGCS